MIKVTQQINPHDTITNNLQELLSTSFNESTFAQVQSLFGGNHSIYAVLRTF